MFNNSNTNQNKPTSQQNQQPMPTGLFGSSSNNASNASNQATNNSNPAGNFTNNAASQPQRGSLFSNANQQAALNSQPGSLFNPISNMSNAQQQQMSNAFSFGGYNNVTQQQVTQNAYQNPGLYVQQQQMPQQIPMQQVYGYNGPPQGYFGFPPQPSYQQENKLYNDDEKLIESAKQQLKDAKIEIQIKAQRSLIKLKTEADLPAMVSLKSSGGSRTSVDLICVIDNSGSMSGQKIQLVKDTIKFLLQTLTPADRLSIITFNSYANRLCGLKCVTGENMQGFLNIVNNINAGGGTNINSGLQVALKTIRERKFINKVTSIFLLSDGQDKGAQQTFKTSLVQPRNKQLGIFTLHSFGFGEDHDQDLMTKLCTLKDGAFYFIKQLATLDEAFCNALGGIISLVANQVILKINNISKNIVQGIKIKKVYGPMWEKISDKQYKIKISQMMSGISKDYVFELSIPAINTQVGDIERDQIVIQSIFTAKGVNGNVMNGECVLQLTLLNENQVISDAVENVDVIENYLRVKASQAIEQNIKKADMQQYAQAQKGIDNMIQSIQQNKKARKQKMQVLVNDLNQIKQKFSHQTYAQEGRKAAISSNQAHSHQMNFQYSNCVQSAMVNQVKAQKRQ